MAETIRDPREEYAINRNKFAQLLLAGLVSTAIITVFGYMADRIAPINIDYARIYGGAVTLDTPIVYSSAWWMGMVFHFIAGALLFPILYDWGIDRKLLPNRAWVKGGLFGFEIWLLFEVIIKPLCGMGWFSRLTPNPALFGTLNLVLLVGYGLLLESMTRVKLVHRADEIRRAA